MWSQLWVDALTERDPSAKSTDITVQLRVSLEIPSAREVKAAIDSHRPFSNPLRTAQMSRIQALWC